MVVSSIANFGDLFSTRLFAHLGTDLNSIALSAGPLRVGVVLCSILRMVVVEEDWQLEYLNGCTSQGGS